MSQVLPITSAPNQQFNATLQVDGVPLTLNFNILWNSMSGYWVMTIFDAFGNLLVDSIPLLTGWYPAANLLAQHIYLKIGSAFIINSGNSESDYPGQTDLGTAFTLVWDDTPVQTAA